MNPEPESPVRIALVILEDEQGRIYLQLRSRITGIANPGKWGLFGGHIEADETPSAGALREVDEELNVHLHPEKLRFVRDWTHEGGRKQYSLFHYPVGDELDAAELSEGERFAAFWPSQIYLGVLDGDEIVSYHLDQLTRFWKAA